MLDCFRACGWHCSSSAPTKPERRTRLKGAGVQILEDFSKIHGFGVEPDKAQRHELLKRIRQIPEYHDYTMAKLRIWFSRRKKEAEARAEEAKRASSSTYPSLNSEALKTLQILYKGAANIPTEDLIETWAKLLGVPIWEVKGWIKAQQCPASPSPGPSTLPSWQPLTPRTTLSPEPPSSLDGFDELDKTDSLFSPVVAFATPPQAHAVPRPMLRPATFSIEDSQEAVRHMLLLAIAETDIPLTPPSKLPSNGEEFNAMFSPYLGALKGLEAALDTYLPAA